MAIELLSGLTGSKYTFRVEFDPVAGVGGMWLPCRSS